MICNVISTKRNEILNQVNNKFYTDSKIYKNMNCSIKSIIASNKQEYYQERYADIEFLYTNVFI
jgi:hypothetical protein